MKKILLLIILSLSVGAQDQNSFNQKAWFQFNGNMKESSGKSCDAVNHNVQFTNDRNGKANRAVQFAGNESYISLESGVVFDTSFDAFTISAWINLTSFPATLIAKNEPICYTNGFAIILGASSASVTIGETTCIIPLTVSLNTGTWYHFTVNWDGDTIRCFVNGNASGGDSCREAMMHGKKGILIGRDYEGSQNLAGKLDDLRLYNYVLDSAGIHDVYSYSDTNQFIAILRPSGGEGVRGGNSYTITWASNGIGRVGLDYSTNSGTNWVNIASSVSADTALYVWNTPLLVSMNSKIRIRNVDAGGTGITCEAPFSILDALIYADITLLLEGFYHPETDKMIPDVVNLSLWTVNTAYNRIDGLTVTPDTLGHCVVVFPNAVEGNYYLVIKHRNHLETWSATAPLFAKGTINKFDFSASQDAAYGGMLIQQGDRWCIFAGDVDQSGYIDNNDLSLVDNASRNHVTGYVVTDVDGNNYVDGYDLFYTDLSCYYYGNVARPPLINSKENDSGHKSKNNMYSRKIKND